MIDHTNLAIRVSVISILLWRHVGEVTHHLAAWCPTTWLPLSSRSASPADFGVAFSAQQLIGCRPEILQNFRNSLQNWAPATD
jgi:hypothetical protein